MSARLSLLAAGALVLLPLISAVPVEARKTTAKQDSAMPGGAKLVQSFGDWGAYTAQAGRSKMCYALSEPKSRSPANLKDTKAYLFISFRPAEKIRNELAVVLNFKTKEKGPGSLVIGNTNYDLITMGQNAWIKTASDESAVIGAMAKGSTLTLQALSAKGNKTADRYSLNGFAQALEQAKRDCP